MNVIARIAVFCCYLLAGIIGFHVLGSEALAAEETGTWRSIFDLVMRWLNFAILAFVLIKYTRTPIKNFLLSKREELAREIDRLEKQKEKAMQKVEQHLKTLEESEARLATLRERIITEGEKNKEAIIQDAQQESRILLENAKHKIQSRIREAHLSVRSELIESAVALAMTKLPEVITPEDEQKWIDRFLASTAGK